MAVISHDFWRDWFASSPGAVGSMLRINGAAFTVIGVAPAGFRGVSTYPSEVFIPAMMLGVGYRWCEDALSEDCTILETIGRLADGRTLDQARAEMTVLVPSRWEGAPEGSNSGMAVEPWRGVKRGASEARLLDLLFLVSGTLLSIGCINLAALQMARNSSRIGEFAVRAALGAGRGRLLRQLVTEALLLSLVGGTSGTLFSLYAIQVVRSWFYFSDTAHPDGSGARVR